MVLCRLVQAHQIIKNGLSFHMGMDFDRSNLIHYVGQWSIMMNLT